MEATSQPLLNPQNCISSSKFLCLTLTLVAAVVFSPIALFSTRLNLNNIASSTTLSLSLVCKNAREPSSCLSMVSELAPEGFLQTKNPKPLKLSLEMSKAEIRKFLTMAKDLHHRISDGKDRKAMVDCVELMDTSIDRVGDSLNALEENTQASYSDVHAWLSAVLTNHFTCLDGLQGPARPMMEPRVSKLIARARASLAMLVAISPKKGDHLLEAVKDKFPSWVTSSDRKLLEALPKDIDPDVVVAKDGSGDYETVNEAIASVPRHSEGRYFIYVKKGVYEENVEIESSMKKVTLVGDGMNSTVITGSRSVGGGWTTFRSATVAAVGDGFIARDIWFQNTAGPENHQAVALRVGADQSVIYRCKIDAYQDTLYPHSLRQFYRDSVIIGTIDFIFGNAAVVLQKCKIIARKPMSHQSNMVTAQGRDDPNQNTGTSIQRCQIIASSDLEPVKGTIKTYLGRPWRDYSRTVVMQSYIGDHIDPSGWSVWDIHTQLDKMYYGEYANTGPGADTSNRVKWEGYHVITREDEARKFTVTELVQGVSWLPETEVPFREGL